MLVALGFFRVASAQLEFPGLLCPPFTVDDLGNTTDFSVQGLLPSSLTVGGDLEMTVIVPVRIMRHRIVCEATGELRNTSSFISVLVEFQCDFNSTQPNLRDCDGSTVLTRQYQYFCNASDLYAVRDPFFVQTVSLTVNFSTPVNTSCVRCINDATSPSNPHTHCESK